MGAVSSIAIYVMAVALLYSLAYFHQLTTHSSLFLHSFFYSHEISLGTLITPAPFLQTRKQPPRSDPLTCEYPSLSIALVLVFILVLLR